MKIILCILLSCTWFTLVVAQDSSSKKWSFAAGIKMNQLATVDPVALDSTGTFLSITPSIKITHPSGIGLGISTNFLAGGQQPGYYMTVVSLGYAIDRPNMALDISYAHFFLQHNLAIPYTPIINELYAAYTYKSWFLQPHIGFDFGFGKDTSSGVTTAADDINLFAGVTHSFDWDLSDAVSLDFSPVLQLNAGTNRYFEFLRATGYITHSSKYKSIVKSQGRGIGRGNSGNNGNSSSPTSLEGLGIANLEANIDLSLSIGHFTIEPSGSLFIPFRGDDKQIFGLWQLELRYEFGK